MIVAFHPSRKPRPIRHQTDVHERRMVMAAVAWARYCDDYQKRYTAETVLGSLWVQKWRDEVTDKWPDLWEWGWEFDDRDAGRGGEFSHLRDAQDAAFAYMFDRVRGYFLEA